jgi:hypothetical protein
MTDQDVFATGTAGLTDASTPNVIRLHDGDRFDVHIGPVRKRIAAAELRMLVEDQPTNRQLVVAVPNYSRNPSLQGAQLIEAEVTGETTLGRRHCPAAVMRVEGTRPARRHSQVCTS